MRVSVIGSSGEIGSFFVKYFVSRGNSVTGYDLRRKRSRGMILADSLEQAVQGAELVLLALPEDETVKVAGEIAGKLDKGTFVLDTCSVKSRIVPRLKNELSGKRFVSIHPLFGPSLGNYKRMRIAYVSSSGARMFLRRAFPDAVLICFRDELSHDIAMSYIQGLVHCLNIALSLSFLRNSVDARRVFTPISFTQSIVWKAVLSQKDELIAYLLTNNKFLPETLEKFIVELEKIKEAAEKKDREGVVRMVREARSKYKEKELVNSIRKVYKIYHSYLSGKQEPVSLHNF